jgi:hypothetical protein
MRTRHTTGTPTPAEGASRRDVALVAVACTVALALPVGVMLSIGRPQGGDYRDSWAQRWAVDIAVDEHVRVQPDGLRALVGRGAPHYVTVPGTATRTGQPTECLVSVAADHQHVQASCIPTR